MVIGIIGAGKVGTTIGKYLSKRDIAVSGFYSRSYESAHEAADFTKTKAYRDIDELVKVSDTLFITTPDGEISNMWDCITKNELVGKTICHFSGSLSSNVFFEIGTTGARGCSIHPMYAFSDKFTSYRQFCTAILTMEGNDKAVNMMKKLFEDLGHKVMTVQAEDKIKYHAAAAMASNYMVGLFQMSLDLLSECGFSEADSYELLGPLVKGNMETVIQSGTKAALTGPVERNDITTVQQHLDSFSNENVKRVYQAIGKELVKIAKEKNPDKDYTALNKILSESD